MNHTHLGTDDFDLYCFDLDGTLIRSYLREGHPPEAYELVSPLEGRLKTVQALAVARKRIALVTNQGGVAMGYQSVQDVVDKLGLVCARFMLFFGAPFSVHYAMGHPNARVDGTLKQMLTHPRELARRKPAPGMLYEAIEAHNAQLARTVFVGDMDSDRECAAKAEVAYRDAGEFFSDL